MPCYTVSTATVQFGKNTDRALLIAAATERNINILSIDLARGEVIVRANRGNMKETTAELKRAYSEQVILATARKNGWQVSWQTNASGNRVAQVERISR